MFREPRKPIDSISPEQWQAELSAHITMEVHKLVKKEEENFGLQFGDAVRMQIIAQFISTVVFEVMRTELPPGVQPESKAATDIHHRRYVDVKEAIEHAISAGFRGGYLTWSGIDKEFICQITPEPAQISSQAN